MQKAIVIGASAGGLPALSQLLDGLVGTIDAAVFVVMHTAKDGDSNVVARHLQRHTSLICTMPQDGTFFEDGHLYVAPADHQMTLQGNFISVQKGAKENRWRPSIDTLFRSAAVHLGLNVIGIVLTGMLDDGTSGMSAIKRCGGVCIVQDPDEAAYPDMPGNVINNIAVDRICKLPEMPDAIMDMLSRDYPLKSVPMELEIEADISARMHTSIDRIKEIGVQSDLTCPACGGGLWKLYNDPTHRYRCYTGHVYNQRELYESNSSKLEVSVWVSIRMMEERKNLLTNMANNAAESGKKLLPGQYIQDALELERHIERLKSLLLGLTSRHN